MLPVLSVLSGCTTTAFAAADLMVDVTPNAVSPDVDIAGDDSKVIADFAVKLFRDTMSGSASADKNPLISPLSVLCALAMTANGAKGETLAQMETVFGLSAEKLNEYLYAYVKRLPSDDKYKVSLANSIWFKDDDRFSVAPGFLQTNADYHGASIYKASFNESTVKDINGWVNDHTEGMIKDIVKDIPGEAVMYLINALAFDAEWQSVYNQRQVRDGVFTTEAGEARDAEMMYSAERMYLDDGSATGFVKHYADRKYAFAAMLPNQGISIADYVASLTGGGLMDTLENAQNVQVNAAVPKFESEYSVKMNDILISMGMEDAFDQVKADFAGLGSYDGENIYINQVLHKTYISVNEKGTKAGAATAVEMGVTSAPIDESKTVYLDRPFVYMLVDCETNLPIFVGTVMDVGK